MQTNGDRRPVADAVAGALTGRRSTPEAGPNSDLGQLYSGFTNSLATAVELVLTPILFFLGGRVLDHRLGTDPVFALVLATLSIVGVVAKIYFSYRSEFSRQEEGKPWTR